MERAEATGGGRFGGMSAAEMPVRRQKSARGEGDRLRQDLLESAANLMATHGDVESISLRAVARDAGVSPTAVYRHFPDHLTLLREASEYCWTNLRDALRDARGGRRPTRSCRSTPTATRTSSSPIDHPGQYRVLFSNKLDLGGESSAVGRSAFPAAPRRRDDDPDPARRRSRSALRRRAGPHLDPRHRRPAQHPPRRPVAEHDRSARRPRHRTAAPPTPERALTGVADRVRSRCGRGIGPR